MKRVDFYPVIVLIIIGKSSSDFIFVPGQCPKFTPLLDNYLIGVILKIWGSVIKTFVKTA